jgi:modulator of FtsH protease HflK
VAEATGQAAHFLKVYEEYKKAPDVTRQRLYLETMERVFGGTTSHCREGVDGVVISPSALLWSQDHAGGWELAG